MFGLAHGQHRMPVGQPQVFPLSTPLRSSDKQNLATFDWFVVLEVSNPQFFIFHMFSFQLLIDRARKGVFSDRAKKSAGCPGRGTPERAIPRIARNETSTPP
jgi:hypothetical protein